MWPIPSSVPCALLYVEFILPSRAFYWLFDMAYASPTLKKRKSIQADLQLFCSCKRIAIKTKPCSMYINASMRGRIIRLRHIKAR